MDFEEVKVELEDQFILRLPINEARKLREILQSKPEKIKKLLKLELNIDGNKGVVHFCKTRFPGTLKKLPTIIESYKTNVCHDKSTMFKTANVCQMLECHYNDENVQSKRDILHGYCPPLKNIKSKRFRKTMYNTDFAIEAESVTKELYYLLSTDLDAVSSKFEVLYEGDNTYSSKQYEKSLFGQLSSDSEVEALIKFLFFNSHLY